jgi:hypothetical protein
MILRFRYPAAEFTKLPHRLAGKKEYGTGTGLTPTNFGLRRTPSVTQLSNNGEVATAVPMNREELRH